MSKVSVIIPCYNSAHLIGDAIESVLEQTYDDWEIVVVDDGSHDAPETVLDAFGNDKIRLIKQPNAGPSAARNNGIKNATGNYIAFLDADDLWFPQKLKKQIDVLESDADIGLVFCDGYQWKAPLSPEKGSKLSRLYARPVRYPSLDLLFKVHMIPTSSVFFRKELVEESGLINEQLKGGEDYEFFLRLATVQSVYYLDEPLIAYRVHALNTSSVVSKENVKQRIWRKLNARHVAVQSNSDLLQFRMVRFFSKMPALVQYLMLLYWRVKYGSSMKYLFMSILKYGKKLLPFSNGA